LRANSVQLQPAAPVFPFQSAVRAAFRGRDAQSDRNHVRSHQDRRQAI
jgi:hypothetical protein